ncbi:MAG: hypothetical protein AB7O97_21130 [Planctomycetota bacterium]
MNDHLRTRGQAGFTFAELAFGMLILVVTSVVLINHVTMNLRSTTTEREKVFAMGKAQAILNEMQGFVEQALPGQSGDLDSLDDGVVNKPNLTIARDAGGNLVPPDHVLSGNSRVGAAWQWSRRITVAPFPGAKNRNVRYSTVRIYKRDPRGVDRVVSELSAVVNAPGTAFPTTQVFDLYLLAIENIPGWWVFMDSIKPFVESTVTDLETRNPGLEVRTHWITKAAFGRNPIYRPYINEANDSLTSHRHVYYYPGAMPSGSASSYYYVPANFAGRISIDGVESHGYDDDTNPYPYALCDYWNHALRYPEELALWQARVDAVEDREAAIAAAEIAGTTPPPLLDDMSKEPTLRLFLEDLNRNPDKYKNALVINLHGELLPMPALRNYSDAARDPVNLPEVRVVTHPEKLRTLRDTGGVTEDAVFRVYAYNTDEVDFVAGGGSPIMPVPIAVDVMDIDLTDPSTLGVPDLLPDVRLEHLPGGVDADGDSSDDDYLPFGSTKVRGDASLVGREMCYEAEYFTPAGERSYTRILLYHTPCVAPEVSSRGLRYTERSLLYGMAYIPSPVENARDFSVDLSDATANIPKNTARWRFRVPASVVAPTTDRLLTVRTRIWAGADPETAGTMWPPVDRNAPENLSTTYTWWCNSNDDVPITECAQFQGDPRHMPYRDLVRDHKTGDPGYPTTSYRPTMPDGYNWYFDDLTRTGENSQADYKALDTGRLAERWRGRMNCDVPRLFELLRKGLVDSNCVYTTLTGWSYYYMGIGNDIGYDSANGYPNSIPVELTPHGGGGDGYFNNITGARTFVRAGGGGSDYWWSMPWLGELAPDSVYASLWASDDGSGHPWGNLVAGNGSGRFYQDSINSVHSGTDHQGYGVTMNNAHQNTSQEGCTSFFNIGTSTSTFHHTSTSGNGTLTAVGNELANNYNFRIPSSAPVSRPFHVASSGTGGTGTEWSLAPYSAERFSGSLFKTYFSHGSGYTGSGLVKLVDPGNADAAYVVVNGFDRTVESGSTFIAKFAVLSLIHSYFEAGSTSNTLRIEQPPRVEIRDPSDISEIDDPSGIDIVLRVSWTRWDGLDYTQTGLYSENEGDLEYVITYSRDGGTTWQYIQDGDPARLGERPDDPTHLVADTTLGDETIPWDVSSGFPQGSYYLRVECYRRGASIHYSYHQTKLFIQR